MAACFSCRRLFTSRARERVSSCAYAKINPPPTPLHVINHWGPKGKIDWLVLTTSKEPRSALFSPPYKSRMTGDIISKLWPPQRKNKRCYFLAGIQSIERVCACTCVRDTHTRRAGTVWFWRHRCTCCAAAWNTGWSCIWSTSGCVGCLKPRASGAPAAPAAPTTPAAASAAPQGPQLAACSGRDFWRVQQIMQKDCWFKCILVIRWCSAGNIRFYLRGSV